MTNPLSLAIGMFITWLVGIIGITAVVAVLFRDNPFGFAITMLLYIVATSLGMIALYLVLMDKGNHENY